MTKGKIIFFIITLIILGLILPTFSLSFREFFDVYGARISAFPDDYFIKNMFNLETYIKFVTIVDPPNVLSWVIIGLYVLYTLFGVFGVLKIHETYSQKEDYGSDGTARWQKKKEIKEYFYKDKVGWFLGSDKQSQVYTLGMDAAYHPVSSQLNMQVNVVGPPGSNKTTGLILPNIFHIPYIYKDSVKKPDLIFTDPKSELYALSSKYLEKMGYEVKVLDFIHLKHGDCLNPLDFITEDKELMEIATGFISCSNNKNKGDIFWEKASALLLASLIGFVKQVCPPDKQNMAYVSELETNPALTDSETAISFFLEHGVSGTPLKLFKKYLLAKDKTKDSILISLATDLTLFAVSGIENITSKTTIDIRKLGAKKDKPIALFILMPDSDNTFSPVINMEVNMILNQLYKTAYLYDNRLYNDIYIGLEEVANIGMIPGLKEKLGTMRGRGIYPMLIWQDYGQIKDIYGSAWESIISKFDTQIFLGFNDEFTAEYASKSLGVTTIKTQGISRKNGGLFGVNTQSESLNYKQRRLLLPDECRRLDNSKMLVIQRSRYPVMLNKVQYKYWIEKYKICDENKIFHLPLIKKEYNKLANNDVNDITHDELKRDDPFIRQEVKKEDIVELNDDIAVDEVAIDAVFNSIDGDISIFENIGDKDNSFDISRDREF